MRTQGDSPTKYCGIEFTELEGGRLRLHQRKYIEVVMERFGQDVMNAKMPKTPMKGPLKPGTVMRTVERPYRQILGALLFVAIGTRMDVTFAVTHLCRHSKAYTDEHWEATRRVMMYLYNTREKGIEYHPEDSETADEVDNELI